jgi:hypothetical protein
VVHDRDRCLSENKGAQDSMIRKSLFWGLTLVLVVALVGLIIRGRQLEKEKSSRPVEIVQESKPSPTKALDPSDLKVLESKMSLEEKSEKPGESNIAHHEIEIQNIGDTTYQGIQLRFEYLDRRGKVLATKTYFVARKFLPRSTFKLDNIIIEDVPVAADRFRVDVDFADIASHSFSKDN